MPTEGLNTGNLGMISPNQPSQGSSIGSMPANNQLMTSAGPSNQMQDVASTVTLTTTVTPFGIYSNPTTNYLSAGGANSSSILYPNDVVTLDIYNNNNQYLETNFRVSSYTQEGNNITLDPEKDLSTLGYISGKYKVQYNFYRNLLGSGDTQKLRIQEISADGLEVRVVPVLSEVYNNVDFINFFGRDFFTLSKTETLVNLFLFKDATTNLRVFDYVQDYITVSNSPYSIIFKLNAPVPTGINVGGFLWLAQQVSDSINDSITIVPPKNQGNKTLIAGPNWDINTKQTTATATQYKDWDDILTTNTETSQGIINKMLSSSFLEGIALNVDYRQFNNHIHFGSATERLQNFKYKVQLLENYDSRIQALTTGLSGLLSGSASSSIYYKNNVVDAQTKKAALLGSMDGYEKYLLYESSSYESSSYGEFYPSTWPKANSTKPYTNYSYTSSQAQNWFDGMIASASVYDQNNDNALYKLIPSHIINDPSNDQYVLFTQMIGHYFDLMFTYVKQMNKLTDRQESVLEGFSKELVYHVSRNLGVDFENGASIDELWSYALGTDTTGSLASTFAISTEDKTKEIWKRIVNNLPHLLKTRGTERGIRALINCFGIPQTILRIREYGGAEASFETKTDFQYERFFYSTTVGYNGQTSGQAAQLISVPWQPLSSSGLLPMAVELRVKMATSQSKTQTILEVPNQWKVEAFQSGSGGYLGFYLSGSQGWYTSSVSCSIYDGNFHLINLQRSSITDATSSGVTQTYTLSIRDTNYQKVTARYSASLTVVGGSTGSSYLQKFNTQGTLWIPGSGSFPAATSQSMNILSGSVQELRYWTQPLQDSILDNHALAPTSFQGNLADTHTGSTSSFYDLAFRLCLGADNKKTNLVATSSIASQHPNQTINGLSGSFYNFSGSYYNPIVEIHSLEWPDLGGNRSVSNKIKIDTTTLSSGNQLYRNTKTEVALSDNNPIDSPRLGVYLSPLNEINQDIAEQFGGLSIDDFIGNPADIVNETYPDLEKLQREYFKKYTKKAGAQNYIRLLKNFDAALFKLIKKFVPYRANTQVGLVIEPTILQRSKVPTKLPTFEELQYSASLSITGSYTVGGFVQDGDGEPFRNGTGCVPAGTISEEVVQVFGEDFIVAEGTVDKKHTTISGTANEFNNTGIANDPSGTDNLAGTIDLGLTSYGRDARVQGSKYIFMTYMTSQSAFVSLYGTATYGTSVYSSTALVRSEPYLVTASRYDYFEPYSPTIVDSTTSRISNITGDIYDTDIYYKKAFTDINTYKSGSSSDYTTIYTASSALYENNWTSTRGLRIDSLSIANTPQSTPYSTVGFWGLTGSLGLYFQNNTTQAYTASLKLPAFFYDASSPKAINYQYKVSVTVAKTSGTPTDKLELHFGDLDCILTASIVPSTSETTYTYNTPAIGSWLGFRAYTDGTATHQIYIKSLSVECLNYRAQVQDFHLRDSRGMKNARYDGCKMTSTDWNINSPDTIDKGPVVVVTVGGGKQLTVKPSTRGVLSSGPSKIGGTPGMESAA